MCWEVTCTPCGYAEIPCKAVNVMCSSRFPLRRPFPAPPTLSRLSGRGRGVKGLPLPSHPRPGKFMPAGPGRSPHSHTPWPSPGYHSPLEGGERTGYSGTLKVPLSKRHLLARWGGATTAASLSAPHLTPQSWCFWSFLD